MRNAFRIFRRDMKRLLRNPAAILVLIGVSILPSLYAWFNIAANIDPYANTSGIKVAVANLDTDATHTKHLHADSPAQKTRAAQLSASCNSLCSCMAFFEGICCGIAAVFCPSLRLV